MDQPFKNWEFRGRTQKFYSLTVKALPRLTDSYHNCIANEVLNVFYKLTNYNNGALVSIQELIDLPTAIFLIDKMGLIREESKSRHKDFHSIYYWGFALEGILFTLYNMDVKFPAPYYPGLGVLEKKDDLRESLISLEEAFFVKKDKKDKKE